jgi:hypothetical protein
VGEQIYFVDAIAIKRPRAVRTDEAAVAIQQLLLQVIGFWNADGA